MKVKETEFNATKYSIQNVAFGYSYRGWAVVLFEELKCPREVDHNKIKRKELPRKQ